MHFSGRTYSRGLVCERETALPHRPDGGIICHEIGMNKGMIVGVVVITIAACAQPTTAPTPVSAASVNASFGKTWNAVIDDLSQRTIPIKTLDRSSGFVAAEVSSVPMTELGTYTTNCGGVMNAMLGASGPGVANYNIVVRGDSTASTVKVTLAIIQGGKQCVTKGSFETGMQDEIKARAETK